MAGRTLSISEFLNILKTKTDGIDGDELQQLIASIDLLNVNVASFFLDKSMNIGDFICDTISNKIKNIDRLYTHCIIENYIDNDGIYTFRAEYCWYGAKGWRPDKFLIYQYIETSQSLKMHYYESTEKYNIGNEDSTSDLFIKNLIINDVINNIFIDILNYF